MAASVSLAAASIFRFRVDCSVIAPVAPRELVDVISVTPAIARTAAPAVPRLRKPWSRDLLPEKPCPP
jgi:hypothetical protein